MIPRLSNNTHQAGFSLVELMVVVGIIGVLSVIAQGQFAATAKRAIAVAQMGAISRGVISIRALHDTTMVGLTRPVGGEWSAGYCIDNNGKAAHCKEQMDKVMKALGFPGAIQSPWGGYYFFDENEGEWGGGSGSFDCRADEIWVHDGDKNVFLKYFIPTYECKSAQGGTKENY